MRRLERKLLRIGEELAGLDDEEALLLAELETHRSLHDDAARDAAVYDSPVERENAYETRKDVMNFERALEELKAKRRRLLEQRDALLDRLAR